MALPGTGSLEHLADAILDAFGFTDRAHACVFSFRNRFGRSFDCYHADWRKGPCLSMKDPAFLMALREVNLVLVAFDRARLPVPAGTLTREGLGHAGVIPFGRAFLRWPSGSNHGY